MHFICVHRPNISRIKSYLHKNNKIVCGMILHCSDKKIVFYFACFFYLITSLIKL